MVPLGCLNRELFKNYSFLFEPQRDAQWYAMCPAEQNPLGCGIGAADVVAVRSDITHLADAALGERNTQYFDCCFSKNRASQDADHVSVLPFLAFTMDGFLKSHSSPLPLDDSMRDVPQRKAATDLAPSVEFTRLEPMVSNPPAWLDRALRASDGRQEESRVVAEAKERAGAADVSSMD